MGVTMGVNQTFNDERTPVTGPVIICGYHFFLLSLRNRPIVAAVPRLIRVISVNITSQVTKVNTATNIVRLISESSFLRAPRRPFVALLYSQSVHAFAILLAITFYNSHGLILNY